MVYSCACRSFRDWCGEDAGRERNGMSTARFRHRLLSVWKCKGKVADPVSPVSTRKEGASRMEAMQRLRSVHALQYTLHNVHASKILSSRYKSLRMMPIISRVFSPLVIP
ncbi:hypothetical protein BC834DRAFT_869934 [Gloeopeniophorella convolvens]|nr:hypothetical protein BC834DRAFT_869934 [Gloeopeniophorella convolvens]